MKKDGEKMSQTAVLKSASATSSYNPARSDKRLTAPCADARLRPSSSSSSSSFEPFLLPHLSDVPVPWGEKKGEKNPIPWPAASSGVRRPLRGGGGEGRKSLLTRVAFKISRKRKVMFIKWRQRRGATCSDSYHQPSEGAVSALFTRSYRGRTLWESWVGGGGWEAGPSPLPPTPLSFVISPLALNFKAPERK